MIITLIIGIGFGVVLLLITYKGKRMEEKRIPTVSGFPVIWNMMKSERNKSQEKKNTHFGYMFQILNGVYQLMHKEKLFKFSGIGVNYIFLTAPETIKKVLKSNKLIDKSKLYNHFKYLLNESLSLNSGDEWRIKRKLLAPTFHLPILEEFQSIFNKNSKILVEKFGKQEQEKPFEIFQILSVCALNIIKETSMGIASGSDICTKQHFLETYNNILSTIFKSYSRNWYSSLLLRVYSITSLGKNFHSDCKALHEFAKNVTETREKAMKLQHLNLEKFQKTDDVGIKQKMCFLDLLLHMHFTENCMTKEEIIDEVLTFIIAGYETTSVTLSWILYLLGLYQDIQEKVFDELKYIFNDDMDRCISSKDLKEMKYLECVIMEALRLYPVIPFIARENKETLRLGEYVVQPNTTMIIFIYGIHHNPELYENPEIFDPDRFLPENSAKCDPFGFLPFSAGPRNCIGQRFAMREMKTICANLLRNFKFRSLDERDKIKFSVNLTLRSKTGIRVTIEKR